MGEIPIRCVAAELPHPPPPAYWAIGDNKCLPSVSQNPLVADPPSTAPSALAALLVRSVQDEERTMMKHLKDLFEAHIKLRRWHRVTQSEGVVMFLLTRSRAVTPIEQRQIRMFITCEVGLTVVAMKDDVAVVISQGTPKATRARAFWSKFPWTRRPLQHPLSPQPLPAS